MKKIILLTTLLLSTSVYALENCPSDSSARWHYCFGSLNMKSGDKYVGTFKDNKRHGQGTLTLSSGSKYVGGFVDGVINGHGTFAWKSGNEYVGEFHDGVRHGQGTFTFSSGSKYVGMYIDNKKHGQGTYTSSNGSKYVGEYKEGVRHGKGTLTYPDGTIKRGYFSNGKYIPDVCEDMKISAGTEAFGDCVVALIKKIDFSDESFSDLKENSKTEENENFITVICDEGRWMGNSIDSVDGDEAEFTSNGTSLLETKFRIPYPPLPFDSNAGEVDISYGKKLKYKGMVTYFYDSNSYSGVKNDYLIINSTPKELLERYVILIPSGAVHLTYSKIYSGVAYGGKDSISTQSFAKNCKLVD